MVTDDTGSKRDNLVPAVVQLAYCPGPRLIGIRAVVRHGTWGHFEAVGRVVLAVVLAAVEIVAEGAPDR